MSPSALTLFAPDGIPEVAPGDDLGAIVCRALDADGIAPRAGDVLVLAQKIVSKAEGRLVRLDDVVPSARAQAIAAETGKDACFVEVVLSESRRVIRTGPNILIVEDVRGFVMANAGIDRSNVDQSGGACVLLLPERPDASAERLREAVHRLDSPHYMDRFVNPPEYIEAQRRRQPPDAGSHDGHLVHGSSSQHH